MKRLDEDDPLMTCLQCSKVKHDGDDGWSTYNLAGGVVHLCGQHGPAFGSGISWAARDQQARNNAAFNALSSGGDAQRAAEQEERRRRVQDRLKRIQDFDMTPSQIHAELSKWVAGQDAAKRVLSTAVRGHYSRVQMRMIEESGKRPSVKADSLPRECVMLLGPTGCGKSFTCRTLSKTVNVPYTQIAATSFSEVGYVGGDASDALSHAVSASFGHVGLAEKSIVFMDECDKIARRAVGNSSSYRDVSGEGVQTALLEMLDTGGSKIFVCPSVSGRRNPNQPLVEFDTRDTFFILGGAFVGLADIVARRIGGKKRLGFGTNNDTPRDAQLREAAILHETLPEDLIEFGLIRELVGRIGSVAVFEPLSRDDLRHIMLEVEDAVVIQQQARARLEHFELTCTDEFVAAICERAYQSGMGARRLRSLTSQTVAAIFFEMSGQQKRKSTPKVLVTAATVEDPTVYEVSRPTRAAARSVTQQRESGPDVADATSEMAEGKCST